MNRIDYFAAHAPGKIPDWFKHQESTRPNEVTWLQLTTPEDQETARAWMCDDSWDLPEHLKWFQEAYIKYLEEKRLWERQNNESRFFQWRQYYAEQMVELINS